MKRFLFVLLCVIASVSAADFVPKYAWRGYMLDCSRHFFSVNEIKKTLDTMHAFGLNVFHWHLTDDSGWRIQIEAFPKLTEVGSVRTNAVERGSTMGCDDVAGRYGPFFYTKDEVRWIVRYAKSLGIDVLPEIDVPGHSGAAIRAYPEFRCDNAGYSGQLCLGKDSTLKAYERILDEVLELFPFGYVHLGGDECGYGCWKECPDCQRRIREEGLRGEKGLQAWFTVRFAKYLESKGRRMVGWDDILGFPGLPQSTVIMIYRAQKDLGCEAARRGHDVVAAPDACCYLDYVQGIEGDPYEYQPFGCVATWRKALAFDPVKGWPEELRRHMLGGQGNLWTELVCDFAGVEWRTWPRLAAIAEALKNGPVIDESVAEGKIEDVERKLRALGVNAAPIGPFFQDPPQFESGVKCLWYRGDFAKLLECDIDPAKLEFDWSNSRDSYRKVYAKRDTSYPSGAYLIDMDWMRIEVEASDAFGFTNACRQLLKLARPKRGGVREFPSCRIAGGAVPEKTWPLESFVSPRTYTNASGRSMSYLWGEPRHMQLGSNYPLVVLPYDRAELERTLNRMRRDNFEAFVLCVTESGELLDEFLDELAWNLRPLGEVKR